MERFSKFVNNHPRHRFIVAILALFLAFGPHYSTVEASEMAMNMAASDGTPCSEPDSSDECACDCDAVGLATCLSMCAPVMGADVPNILQFRLVSERQVVLVRNVTGTSIVVSLEPDPPKHSTIL